MKYYEVLIGRFADSSSGPILSTQESSTDINDFKMLSNLANGYFQTLADAINYGEQLKQTFKKSFIKIISHEE